MAKLPQKSRRENRARRRTKEEILRMRESDWTLFIEAGYVLFTTCGHCCEQRMCRGRTRERMACRECYLVKGSPTAAVFTQRVESVTRSGDLPQ